MEQSHDWAIGLIGVLTGREQQVAALAKSGLSNKGIAKGLGLSEGTVNTSTKFFRSSESEAVQHSSRPNRKSRIAAAFGDFHQNLQFGT